LAVETDDNDARLIPALVLPFFKVDEPVFEGMGKPSVSSSVKLTTVEAAELRVRRLGILTSEAS
jgi:hypothetical protein